MLIERSPGRKKSPGIDRLGASSQKNCAAESGRPRVCRIVWQTSGPTHRAYGAVTQTE
jgi:hypothetical protein